MARFAADHVGLCPVCGKHMFTSRRKARSAARTAHPGTAMRHYRCGGYWHYGHNPAWLVRGETRGARR